MNALFKIAHWISNLFFTVLVVLTIVITGMYLQGGRTYIVLSGSMEPGIPTGSLLFVYPADYHTLEAGDIITFRQSDDIVVTHRILSVRKENGDSWFQTKGDANEAPDGNLVHGSNVIGCPFFHVPVIGYLLSALRSPAVWYMAAAIGATGVFFLLLPDIFPEKRGKRQKGKYESMVKK